MVEATAALFVLHSHTGLLLRPLKGQRTDLKSVTLTPHTLQHPPLHNTHTSIASHSFLSPEENEALFASLISSVLLNQVVGTPLPAVFDPVLGESFCRSFLFLTPVVTLMAALQSQTTLCCGEGGF